MKEILVGVVLGLLAGVSGTYLWLMWYFRDVMK